MTRESLSGKRISTLVGGWLGGDVNWGGERRKQNRSRDGRKRR